jgi:N,N'-diacetyllegionaminate synthase
VQVTFVIAEACVNFRTLDEAATLIERSARAGVDAVKFQAYRPEDVRPHERYQELNKILMLGPDCEYLKEVCDHNQVEFMCTPFYPKAVEMLSPFVRRWKIRYLDRNNVDLYAALRGDGRPVLVSCQGKRDTIFIRRPAGKNNIIMMFCVPDYPPQHVQMPTHFGDKSGFSSHYPDWQVPLRAVRKGANYLEVHVKLDRYGDGWVPIDNAVSLKMKDLKRLVQEIRAHEKTVPGLVRS